MLNEFFIIMFSTDKLRQVSIAEHFFGSKSKKLFQCKGSEKKF